MEGRCAILVLSRQRNEVIVIGKDIEVMVIDIRGDKVRLGITAPRDVKVNRQEVQQRIDGGEPVPVRAGKAIHE